MFSSVEDSEIEIASRRWNESFWAENSGVLTVRDLTATSCNVRTNTLKYATVSTPISTMYFRKLEGKSPAGSLHVCNYVIDYFTRDSCKIASRLAPNIRLGMGILNRLFWNWFFFTYKFVKIMSACYLGLQQCSWKNRPNFCFSGCTS